MEKSSSIDQICFDITCLPLKTFDKAKVKIYLKSLQNVENIAVDKISKHNIVKGIAIGRKSFEMLKSQEACKVQTSQNVASTKFEVGSCYSPGESAGKVAPGSCYTVAQGKSLVSAGTQPCDLLSTTDQVTNCTSKMLANPVANKRATHTERESGQLYAAEDNTGGALLGTEDMVLVYYCILLHITMATLLHGPYTARQHHGTRPPDQIQIWQNRKTPYDKFSVTGDYLDNNFFTFLTKSFLACITSETSFSLSF